MYKQIADKFFGSTALRLLSIRWVLFFSSFYSGQFSFRRVKDFICLQNIARKNWFFYWDFRHSNGPISEFFLHELYWRLRIFGRKYFGLSKKFDILSFRQTLFPRAKRFFYAPKRCERKWVFSVGDFWHSNVPISEFFSTNYWRSRIFEKQIISDCQKSSIFWIFWKNFFQRLKHFLRSEWLQKKFGFSTLERANFGIFVSRIIDIEGFSGKVFFSILNKYFRLSQMFDMLSTRTLYIFIIHTSNVTSIIRKQFRKYCSKHSP